MTSSHINANPVFQSYSCLNIYVKAEHDKKIGHNYTKKTVLTCIQVTSMGSSFLCHQFANLHREYYTVARRYEFYFRVAKQYCFCHENKIHIFKLPNNVLFII